MTTILKDMNSVGLARGVNQVQGGVDKKVGGVIFFSFLMLLIVSGALTPVLVR